MNLLHRMTMRAASPLWILGKKITLLAPRIAATTYFECDGNCLPLYGVDPQIAVITSSHARRLYARATEGSAFGGFARNQRVPSSYNLRPLE